MQSPPSGSLSAPLVSFSDQAAEVGLILENVSGSAGKDYILETTGAGACFLDYDLDGDLDLYIVNGATIETLWSEKPARDALYLNDGGRFTDVTFEAGVHDTGWGGGCASADYDNDGDPDIYITNFGPNVLLRNDGHGRLTDVTEEANVAGSSWSLGAAFFDIEPDGDLDLYVANYLTFTTAASGESRNKCSWKGIEVMCGPRGMPAQADALYLNDGKGSFREASAQAGTSAVPARYGMGVVAGDVDDDGDTDLFIANDSQDNHLLLNEGGRFEDGGLWAGVALSGDGRQQAGMGADLGDFDNDGDEDLFVTNFSDDYHTLYRNDGGGLFIDVTVAAGLASTTRSSLGWGGGFFDYDNDGDLDLFVAGGHVYMQVDGGDPSTSYRQRNLLFRNEGDGSFSDVSERSGRGMRLARSSRGAAFGDYDDDGDLDIAVINENDGPTLLRNDGGNALSWIKLRLVGSPSNRDGIGARLRLRAGQKTQFLEVRRNSGYLSSHDPRIHFGLGGATRVDRLEIRWPSGRVQVLEDLPARRLVIVHEQQGVLGESTLARARPGAGTPSEVADGRPETPTPTAAPGSAEERPPGEPGTLPAPEASPARPVPSNLPVPSGGRLDADALRGIDALALTGARRIAAGEPALGVSALEEAVRRLPAGAEGSDSPDAFGFGDPDHYVRFLASLYANLGVGLMRAEDFQACGEAIARAISLAPDRARYHRNLGLCLFHGRRHAEAVEALETARKLGDSTPALGFDLVRSLASSGRCDAALAELAGSRQGAFRDPEGRAASGWYHAGSCLAERGRHEEAIDAFKEVLALLPGHQRALYRLAVSLRARGRTEEAGEAQALFTERQSAEETARSMERAGPRGKSARVALVREYLSVRLPDEAFVEIQKLLESAPANASVQVLLGQAHLDLRPADLGAAEEAFRAARDLDPSDPEAHTGLGAVALRRGRPEEAEAQFRQALNLRPGQRAAVVALAEAIQASGRVAEAAAALREILSRNEDDAEARLALAGLYASAPAGPERRPAEALRLLEPIRALYGEDLAARVAALAALGRPDEAERLVERSPFLGNEQRRAMREIAIGTDP